MRKIGVIERKGANLQEAILIGGIITFLIGWITFRYLDLSISYLTEDKLVEVLCIIPTIILFFIVHECIHVVFFLLFGKGKAKIEVKREKSLGAIIMHQVNDKVYYSKGQMVIILLSPLVLLTIGLAILNSWIAIPFLLWINIILNALGSSTDLYITYQLIKKYKGRTKINLDSSEIKMNVYQVEKRAEKE